MDADRRATQRVQALGLKCPFHTEIKMTSCPYLYSSCKSSGRSAARSPAGRISSIEHRITPLTHTADVGNFTAQSASLTFMSRQVPEPIGAEGRRWWRPSGQRSPPCVRRDHGTTPGWRLRRAYFCSAGDAVASARPTDNVSDFSRFENPTADVRREAEVRCGCNRSGTDVASVKNPLRSGVEGPGSR